MWAWARAAPAPYHSHQVIPGELIAGGASGFSLSIAGLRHILLGFIASCRGGGFGMDIIIGHDIM